MTAHAEWHRQHARRLISSAVDQLRGHGQRLTAARRAVLEILADRPQHLTAEEVAELAAPQGVHRTTVYRAVEAFSRAGILVHRQEPGGPSAYHLAVAGHLHGYCSECGLVIALPRDVLDSAAEELKQAGLHMDIVQTTLVGWCERCAG